MRHKTKRKWKQRIYGYLFEMKKGEEQKVATIITNEIETYVMDLNTQLGEHEDFIAKLKNENLRVKKELSKLNIEGNK